MTSVRELIECAVQLLGSEIKLAKACEVTQNAISQAKSGGRAHQFLAELIQRRKFEIGLCNDATGRFQAGASPNDISAKEAHLPQWVRQ